MKQLFVLTNDTYADGMANNSETIADIDDLVAGAFVMINKDPNSADFNDVVELALTTEEETPDFFQLFYKSANALEMTPVLKKSACRIKNTADGAGTAKVMAITNALSSLAVGNWIGFYVTDLSKPPTDPSRDRLYDVTANSGHSVATIYDALVAAVTADTDAIVTPADGGTSITLTAKTAGKPFNVSVVGDMVGAAITTGTQNVPKAGLGADLANYEKEARVYRGSHNELDGDDVFTETKKLVSTSYYDQWLITWKADVVRDVIKSEENLTNELLICGISTLTAAGTANKTNEALTNFAADLSKI